MLAWSADGKWLCLTSEVGTSANHALFLLSPESGALRQLLPEHDSGEGDSSPAFSPDGRWLAFCRFLSPNHSQLLLQRLSSDLRPEGAPLAITEAGVNPSAPVWTPDGKRVLFLEGSRIMQAQVGGPARQFYASIAHFAELTLAGAAARPRIVASLKSSAREIWSISLRGNGLAASSVAQRIVPSTAGEGHPRFSPDGRQLVFQSNRSGASEIWVADSDGTNPRQITHTSAYAAGFPHWSPDGRFLAFHARFSGDAQLYVVRTADGVIKQISSGRPGLLTPSWSLDGKTLYANAPVNGETNIYRVSADGGAPTLLWKGADAIEVPGHELLIYDKEDESGIYGRSLVGDSQRNPERLFVSDFFAPWAVSIPSKTVSITSVIRLMDVLAPFAFIPLLPANGKTLRPPRLTLIWD